MLFLHAGQDVFGSMLFSVVLIVTFIFVLKFNYFKLVMVYTINVLIKKYLLRKSNSFLSQSEAEFEINLWYFVAKSSFSFNQLLNTVASNSEFTYKIVELV